MVVQDNADVWQEDVQTSRHLPVVRSNGLYDDYRPRLNAAWGYVSAYGGNLINFEETSITWDPFNLWPVV
jgi:hypothetical protein